MNELRTVCVYCGSSNQVDARYLEMATRLGTAIGRRGLQLIYGGGGVGLMGRTAIAAQEAGSSVLGILPRFLEEREPPIDIIPTQRVETMHERKRIMFERSDAFVVLPGGIGTLEEIVETLSWYRLDLHRKPTVFIDATYWGPFFELMEHMIEAKFTNPEFRAAYACVDAPEEAIDALERALSGIIESPIG
jgi:uncharacterized protein (TIGR00730 family)